MSQDLYIVTDISSLLPLIFALKRPNYVKILAFENILKNLHEKLLQ